jgi:superfamily II DNA/RNA helicase
VYRVDEEAKRDAVVHLLRARDLKQVLVFSNTKIGASRLSRELERQGIKAAPIHGDKTQNERMAALEAFKNGSIDVLVATDVAARGLDIAELPCVINYDLPYSAEDYVHRIGRTGRAGASGDAWSLCSDKDIRLLADIEKLIRQKLTPIELEGFEGRSARHAVDKTYSESGTRRHSDRGERSHTDRPRSGSASTPVPRKEKVDPWFLKPYEPSAPAQPQPEPVLSKNAKTAAPVRRAALLGGSTNKT